MFFRVTQTESHVWWRAQSQGESESWGAWAYIESYTQKQSGASWLIASVDNITLSPHCQENSPFPLPSHGTKSGQHGGRRKDAVPSSMKGTVPRRKCYAEIICVKWANCVTWPQLASCAAGEPGGGLQFQELQVDLRSQANSFYRFRNDKRI